MKKTIALLLIAVSLIAMLSGCDKGKDSNEIGYIKANSQYEIKVVSENKIFDIDNVTLNFEFGHKELGVSNESLDKSSYGYEFVCFAFYFVSGHKPFSAEIGNIELGDDYRNVENAYLIKELSAEEFLVEEYLFTGDVFLGDRREFNHSEEITVPKEIFTSELKEIFADGVSYFCFFITKMYFSTSKNKYYAQESSYLRIGYEFIDENTVKLKGKT